MDSYCSIADTGFTYKHYSDVGRAAIPCSGFEDLMDSYCSIADTGFTYKHYSDVGRAAIPCSGFEDRQDDLLKSLAMKMFAACTSWCVYDYYSDAELAWKWSSGFLCWDLKTWGS